MLKKTIYALSFMLATASQIHAASSTECSTTDSKDVRTAIEDYVSKNTKVAANEIEIKSLKCTNDYAAAIVHPQKPVTDDATVYLQKKGTQWEVLSLGTAFDEELLSTIPKELQNP